MLRTFKMVFFECDHNGVHALDWMSMLQTNLDHQLPQADKLTLNALHRNIMHMVYSCQLAIVAPDVASNLHHGDEDPTKSETSPLGTGRIQE